MPVSVTTARRTDLIPAAAVWRLMDDAPDILPFDVVPLQTLLGSESIENIKPEWLNEDLDRQTCVPSTTYGTGVSTIVLLDSSNIRVNDVLKVRSVSGTIGTLMMKVLTNVYGTNTITVTRPFAGSTDQSIGSSDVLEVVGQDLTEGQDPQDPRDTDFTSDFNYSQIFEEAVQATRTSRKNRQYGVDDPYSHAEMKKYRELNVRLERALIHGRRQQSGATRQMGGLLQYVGTAGANVAGGDYSGAKSTNPFALDGTATGSNGVLNALQNAYEAGAAPDLLVVSPAMKRYISSVYAGTTVFTQRTDETYGRLIQTLHTDFADIQVEMDRQIPRTRGFLLQREYVRRLVFEPWRSEPLAKTGDTDKGMIVGEFSLKVKNPLAHATITVTDL